MASARSAYCRACAPSSASRAAIWENRSVWGERLSITGWPQKATLLPFRKASRASSPCAAWRNRSEEHTSELQSLRHLVCRLLLEKKKKRDKNYISTAYKTNHHQRMHVKSE